MKLISIVVPTYNEEENIVLLCEAIIGELVKLTSYDYELIFIDNDSTDKTRELIAKLCSYNKKIKAIFNAKNFGQFNSPYYGLCQINGDCAIILCADFQDPVDMIPKFIEKWEKGYKIVCGIKTQSKENKIVRLFRTIFYKLINQLSDIEHIEHFTGFGLFDKSFITILKNLKDPSPFLRGIVAEFGVDMIMLPYVQQKRLAGKTKNNFFTLFDAAMLSFTSYTKTGIRIATFFGGIVSTISILIAITYLVLKIMFWNAFPAGNIPILLLVLVFGSLQIMFIGIIGEYILTINTRSINRPIVIEKERINFDIDEQTIKNTPKARRYKKKRMANNDCKACNDIFQYDIG